MSLVLFLFNEVVKVDSIGDDHLTVRIGELTISKGSFAVYGLLGEKLFYHAVLSGSSIT